ncbi:ATP-binding cassette domain-containing protein, partial [archaeon]
TSSQEAASTLAGSSVGILLLFGGFLITYSKIPEYAYPIYYFSPFSWTVRSIVNNEFSSSLYDVPLVPGAPPGSPGAATRGETYMAAFDFEFSFAWRIVGPFVCLGLHIILGYFLCSIIISRTQWQPIPGTKRLNLESQCAVSVPIPSEKTLKPATADATVTGAPVAASQPDGIVPAVHDASVPAGMAAGSSVAPSAASSTVSPAAALTVVPVNSTPQEFDEVPVPTFSPTSLESPAHDATLDELRSGKTSEEAASSTGRSNIQHASSSRRARGPPPRALGGLSCIPVHLAFKDIKYTVPVKPGMGDSGSNKRTLLRDISGVAEPGTMTALMGASGAGKTTLLDVLANRKTVGVVEGDKRVNGHALSRSAFARLTGYCEQEDVHIDTSTVEEAIRFSADCRLDPSIGAAQRAEFVAAILDVLELMPLRRRLVGTLAPGEAKRLTLGVELAANPSCLFLDEPTTGLDARSAA